MKILLAIQGTGNGHLARGREIYLELTRYGSVDVLISGSRSGLKFPFPVKYRFRGLSFVFGRNGGVNIWQTIAQVRLFVFFKDVRRLPIKIYDVVINDFEPISAHACRTKSVRCIALSHQFALRATECDIGWLSKIILRWYVPLKQGYGFDFVPRNGNIFSPIIRHEVRTLTPVDSGHYTVYLPAYDISKIVSILSGFPKIRWEVFSNSNHAQFRSDNILIRSIQDEAFAKSMASASGVLCAAGFQTPAEAIYLGKKLLVIPMHVQPEQRYNAQNLRALGATVLKNLSARKSGRIAKWLENGKPIKINFPDLTSQIVYKIITENAK